jgi:hypothetical protein
MRQWEDVPLLAPEPQFETAHKRDRHVGLPGVLEALG